MVAIILSCSVSAFSSAFFRAFSAAASCIRRKISSAAELEFTDRQHCVRMICSLVNLSGVVNVEIRTLNRFSDFYTTHAVSCHLRLATVHCEDDQPYCAALSCAAVTAAPQEWRPIRPNCHRRTLICHFVRSGLSSEAIITMALSIHDTSGARS